MFTGSHLHQRLATRYRSLVSCFQSLIFICLGVIGCSSQETSVLEPYDDTASREIKPKGPYRELLDKLAALGYQGVGLEHEPEEVLGVLLDVFSNPKAAGRRLKLIYTGLHMSYDPKAESLTIGGIYGAANAVDRVLQYIEKNVPKVPGDF